jgi:flagellin
MGYLETAMRTLDAASALVSRMQELAILGANETNTIADHEAINNEAEALADELHRLLTKATYKGKDVFLAAANSEYVALGGRAANLTFGVKKVTGGAPYTDFYVAGSGPTDAARTNDPTGAATISPNTGGSFNLQILPSEAVIGYDGTVATSSSTPAAVLLSTKLEAFQKELNTARVQAGSQYAALESAVNYTTDLTAQYELGYNTVNDVNFSMETAHLAKNQILQQAATAMLAQANSGQQGLLQLIQR